MTKKLLMLITGPVLLLSACAHVQGETKYPTGYDRTETNGDIYAKRQSIMGDNGFCFGGSDRRSYMSSDIPEVFDKAKISLAVAVKNAEVKTQGRAFDARIDVKANMPRYIVKLLKRGKAFQVLVDAETGAIKEIKGPL